MPVYKQQSSILTEQELQLLSSLSDKPQEVEFTVYSFYLPVKLENCFIYLCNSLEELLIMLSASPRGSALVLPDTIGSASILKKLRKLLKIREDIHTFWVGELPSMAVELPRMEHCADEVSLQSKMNLWQQQVSDIFKKWLQDYSVAFITDELAISDAPHELENIGLQHLEYFSTSVSASDIENKQLVIIDLTADDLQFVDLLVELSSRDAFPVLLLFGELPANLCRAAYNLAHSKGFSILASLSSAPDAMKWLHLFHSLFSKTSTHKSSSRASSKKLTYRIYNIEKQCLDSYLCLYGICKKQVAKLAEQEQMQKIINLQSLLDWFPDGIRRGNRCKLSEELNCQFKQIGIWFEEPEKIKTTSVLFATLLMVSLSRLPVYWLIDNETQLSDDVLNKFPVSDIIFSETISYSLLDEPSEELLHFVSLAKRKNIRLGTTLQQNQALNDAMALHGIEYILNLQD